MEQFLDSRWGEVRRGHKRRSLVDALFRRLAVDLIDQPGDKSWPIESATFIELPMNPTDSTRSAAVMKFFDWAYKNGDASATALEYVPLPDSVKTAVRNAWHANVKGPEGKPIN